MALYSFTIWSPQPVSFVDPLILLDEGSTTFTADVQDLAEFREALKTEGCRIDHCGCLDDAPEEQAEAAAGLALEGLGISAFMLYRGL